ncbi:MAG: ubiquinol-cytochrome C chaperone family protein [Pseudomonadota bacterium]
MKLSTLLSRSRFDDRAHDLYDAIVGQSRQPAFYLAAEVPDSVDGRFDMIVMHTVLVGRRLRACGEAGRGLDQALFDLMFADMDRSLREMGVGDLRVGRRIKIMLKAFYGRAKAYDEALDRAADNAAGAAAMEEAVLRNLYGTVEPGDASVSAVTAYVFAAVEALDSQADDDLLAGKVTFPGFDTPHT